MKALKTIVFLMALCCAIFPAAAQSGSSMAIQRAVLFADSLDKAFLNSDWNEYISLSYPGVVRYYGGREGFREYSERARSASNPLIGEENAKVELIQILQDAQESQCVIRKTSRSVIDGRKAEVISYMIGQSKNQGRDWAYFDVGYNSVENVVYIMPDMFDKLSIPQRQIIFEKDEIAHKMLLAEH